MADIKLEVEYGGYSIRWVDYDRTFDLFRDDVKVKSAINTVQSCLVRHGHARLHTDRLRASPERIVAGVGY